MRAQRVGGSFHGQASVELALLVPIGLVLIFAVLGVARLTTAAISLSVKTPAHALRSGNLELEVDTSDFGPAGEVRAVARYRVSLVDVPFLGLGQLQVSRAHAEPVGTYRAIGP